MPIFVNDAGTWKNATPYVRDAGVWKVVQIGYVRDAGTWKIFFTNITLSNSGPASGARLGAGSVTTSVVTATVTGGVGPYTYAWIYVSGDTFTPTAPTSAATAFTTTLAITQTKTGVYQCTVTDANGSTAVTSVTVTAIETT
jgi:hypothetical protein